MHWRHHEVYRMENQLLSLLGDATMSPKLQQVNLFSDDIMFLT